MTRLARSSWPSARWASPTARRRPPSCASARCSRASRSRAPRRPPRSTTSRSRSCASTTATPARRRPTRRPTRRCATSPRAPGPPRAPRRAPPASPATTPACPRRRPRARTTASIALTAQLDPGAAGEALSVAFERCAAAGLQAFGIWTAGAVDTAIASSHRRARARQRDRRLHEGHRAPRERAVGLGGRHRHLDRRARPGRAGHARGGQGHPRGAGRARARASTRWCSSTTPSARCSSSSAAWPSTASPTPRAAARWSGAWASGSRRRAST